MSSVVIYTQASEQEVLREISRSEQEVRNLIHSTRQKDGHIILMATEENDEELRQGLPRLREMGMQAKEYHRYSKDASLPRMAAIGMQEKVDATGTCRAFLAGNECRFGRKCKFKCYPQAR